MKLKLKKEYFSIPNLMGYFRILMLPVFLRMYTNANSKKEYFAAFFLLAVLFLTDFFDGKIARRFNMVTEWGKALDPLADKLTQGFLALAVISNYPQMRVFFVIFLVKEFYMLFMGLYLKSKKDAWNGAQWYGKAVTWIVDIGIFILLLFTDLPSRIANTIIIIMTIGLLFSLAKYIQFHLRILKS